MESFRTGLLNFKATPEILGLCLLWFFCRCFFYGSHIGTIVDFHEKTHDLNDNGMIIISFDLNSVFKTIVRESSLQTWPWQTLRIFSPEYFCPTGHFAQKFFKISETGKLCSPPRLVRRWKCSLKQLPVPSLTLRCYILLPSLQAENMLYFVDNQQ